MNLRFNREEIDNMNTRQELEQIMRNRIKTIIDSKGKVLSRYESQTLTVKDVVLYLDELGYKPNSKATILEVDKYYVYTIGSLKYVVKKELDGVSFYLRGY